MEVDIIVTISIAFALIFFIAQLSRIIRTNALHKTLRASIEKGHPLDAELIERMERSPAPGAIDQRIGFVLVATALALVAAGLLQGDPEKIRNMATAAMFPLFVGGALLLRLKLAARQGERQLTPDEELQLVRRAAGEDLAAFGALVRHHEAALRRYLRRLAGDEADDLAQETLLAAWRAMGDWRAEGSVASWLRAIATRKFLDRRRKERARNTASTDAASWSAACGADNSPHHRLIVDQALASLPPSERAAALLVFAEGHSHAEAAAAMGVPLGTLKSIIARARGKLIALLEGVSP